MTDDTEVDTRVVVYCTECRVHWQAEGEPPPCVDTEHRHQQFDVHRHCSLVVLPGGTEVVAVSFDAGDPYTRDRATDFGVYLDGRWQPPWPHQHVEWPDFGVPADAGQLVGALRQALEKARRGMRVEIGCLGGHGRTGTALALLAIECGVEPAGAIDWVRANYCGKAVETDEQRAFVASFTPSNDRH